MNYETLDELCKALPIDSTIDPITYGEVSNVTLVAPTSYWKFKDSSDLMKLIVNGCGPEGFLGKLIPDNILGIDISPACNIHDYMYTIFNSDTDFTLSNNVFRDNLIRLIMAHNTYIELTCARRDIINSYYKAVCDFGRPFYYDAHKDLYPESVPYK